MPKIASFQSQLTTRLLAWGLFNVIIGALLQGTSSPFWRAFGQQSIGWGVINTALAIFGRHGLRRKLARGYPTEEAQRDAHNLRRILWINTGLDVLYVAGGWQLARSRGGVDAKACGHGVGVVVQGAFLFVFDLLHAIRLPQASSSEGR
ncbi:MAG: hypothetical protein WHS90_19775 [Caldilinea sp.]|jgi:hypothetical protein|uniref:DUF6992 family protein n=1 Tax=Caldilinea sp. TaxID=2293560 RepID=UPI00309B0B3B